MRAPVPARILLLALVCLAAAACGGSGDDTPSAAPATTTAPATSTAAAASPACADAAALRSSLDELDRLDPSDAGKAGMQAALQKVRTNLAALKTSAAGQWGSQVTELDSAIDAFQTTIAGDGDRLLADLPTILGDLERIDSAWTALDQQIKTDCPTGG